MSFHTNGPDTEKEAFAKITPHQRELQRRVYNVIERSGTNGVCADEIITATQMLDYTCRPRITELKQLGAVVSIGRRPNKRGNNEMVYATAFPGKNYDEAFTLAASLFGGPCP